MNSVQRQLSDVKDIINDIKSTFTDSSLVSILSLPRTLNNTNVILSGTIELLFRSLKYTNDTSLADIASSLVRHFSLEWHNFFSYSGHYRHI